MFSIPNILFNSLINSAANCGSLSKMILSGSLYNFYILSLNSLASSSADVFSVVEIKWTIFVNLSTTTEIESYSWASGNLVIKSTKIYVQGLSGIELGIDLSAGCSVQFLFLWQELYPFIYCFTSLITPSHQKFLVTSSTIFHCSPYIPTGIS